MTPDLIEKSTKLSPPLDRVWRAISDAHEFGSWFGMKLAGPFREGTLLRGAIAPTTVDAEIARLQKPYEGWPVELFIDRIEPKHLFSFRWHPFAIEKGVDYSKEPMTLIRFTLDQKSDAVVLTITESGFHDLPVDRRDKAFQANEDGWSKQLVLIEKYLERAV